jgi:hypothetical protein
MPSRRVSAALRDLVGQRADWCCEYRKTPERFVSDSYSMDHILPRSRGGFR